METHKRYGYCDVLTSGKPYLRRWQGKNKVDYPLSISHEKDYIVAVVMNIPVPETEPV
jgi:phosphopantetheinyl transferase (holo-ACP synthase)